MTLSVRAVVTDDEFDALFRFRYRIYVSELSMTADADHERGWLRDEQDDYATSFAVFDDTHDTQSVVGSLRLTALSDLPDPSETIDKFEMQPAVERFGTHSICTTSRFVLDTSLRHGKIIYRLMRETFRSGSARGLRLNYGDCSPHLLPFYEHLGYRRYTRGFNDTAFGYKVPILMLARDREFLERVRSPLTRLVAEDDDDQAARAWFESSYPSYLESSSAAFLPDDQFFELLSERVASDPLHDVGLLKGLDRDEAQRFLAQATLLDLAPGDLIIREGDVDNTLFVLLSGLAEAVLGDPSGAPINVIGAGDTFGEIGFLTRVPRTVNVVARTPGRLLVISGDFLDRFVTAEPGIGAKVLLNLSRELAARLTVATHRTAIER